MAKSTRHAGRCRATALGIATLCASLSLIGVADGATPVSAQIDTVVGGDGEGQATEVAQSPLEVATFGPFLYIGDDAHNVVRVLDTRTGEERVLAGNGYFEWSGGPQALGGAGDGGPAIEARLSVAAGMGLATDSSGSVYIADAASNRVRKVDVSGTITTVAGRPDTCCFRFSGDGGPATSAELSIPSDVVVDAVGNLYIADTYNHRVRRVDPSGRITTVAGDGTESPRTDGVPGTSSALQLPGPLALDGAGNLYVGSATEIVRRISPAGIITTVAGAGGVGPSGDGGPATAARVRVGGLAADAAGDLFISDDDRRVRRVDAVTGMIDTVAGQDLLGFGGDGGPATAARLDRPRGLALDGEDNLYIADEVNERVRRMDRSGTIDTVAGNGERNFSGDGGAATAAELNQPWGVGVDPAGNVYVADHENNRVRKVDVAGEITTVASISEPTSLVAAGDGTVFVAGAGDVVHRVETSGAVTRYAGGGLAIGAEGDGGPATEAYLGLDTVNYPSGLALDGMGNLYIADSDANRVRKVDPAGTITTVVSGDGPPRLCSLVTQPGPEFFCPGALATDAAGSLYISEPWAKRVRRLDAAGNLTIVSLPGSYYDVAGLAADPAGNLLMSAPGASGVFRRDPDGNVTRVAGTGFQGFGGDGGPGQQARLNYPRGIALLGADLLVADTLNDRVRRVTGVGQDPPTLPTARSWGWNGFGQSGTGTLVDSRVPAEVPGLGSVSTVAAGYLHSLAVKDGEIWAWGWNGFGQLGTGTTAASATPVKVEGLSDVIAVAAGTYHSLATTSDGGVWAWGWNGVGQLGTGNTTDSLVPVRVGVPGGGGTSVTAGAYHSAVTGRHGEAWSWGWNGLGQLGDGTTVDRRTPVRVVGMGPVSQVSAGFYHTLARQDGGPAWAWGWNGLGQLGDGTIVARRAPVQLTGLGQVAEVSAGYFHSIARGEDGRVWTWGWNQFGQLGDGTVSERHRPRAVPGLGGVGDVAAGAFHSVAVRADGTAVAWGWNVLGQLGDDTTTDRPLPVPVAGTSGLTQVSGGAYHTLGS